MLQPPRNERLGAARTVRETFGNVMELKKLGFVNLCIQVGGLP